MKITAYAIKNKGGKAQPFSYERNLVANEVLVRITHCGMAKGDIQGIEDEWGDTTFPLVPGHEIVGLIEETGRQVTTLEKGDRVGIGYQQEACFTCTYCREGNEQFCPDQKVIAVDCYGGLAEYIIVDSRFAFKLPSILDPAKSVPLLSSGLTVYTGIIRANLKKNSIVAVSGVGGLGELATQFLDKMGHKVFAFSHSPQKKELIHQLGARYIDSSTLDSQAELHRKFDFILSTVNANFQLDTYLKMLKPQGKLCLVAQTPDKLSMSAGLLYDYAQRTIYGNYTGSRQAMMDMLAFAAEHAIESRVEVIPFSQMNEAIERVKGGKVAMRVVLEQEK
ncbi:NAD(P)-dependent alcohol dehydrogenase [Rhodocytophaga rosea]|uniref:NAD(P)-dependent alcohol dehydrogenase n=1 Tax=Rhodocytophaga rosea TaxID=2704465 RepID=A0A6C0GE56_9BACT|nr:NAD(P)-dependent alcohol dehydrogenase [Rhodocytophaga rosea]QHT66228.1 NAD(P)-dependent alcohol dehydrogenase [Rhodocytophaga rosea]